MITPFASASPYLIGVGNHESGAWGGERQQRGTVGCPSRRAPRPTAAADYPGTSSWQYYGNATDSGGECSQATSMVFPLPATATTAAPYYAFASGPVFLVVLSTEHDFTTGSAQLQWLGATLKAVNRTATPFLIVSAHRPMYIDSNCESACCCCCCPAPRLSPLIVHPASRSRCGRSHGRRQRDEPAPAVRRAADVRGADDAHAVRPQPPLRAHLSGVPEQDRHGVHAAAGGRPAHARLRPAAGARACRRGHGGGELLGERLRVRIPSGGRPGPGLYP